MLETVLMRTTISIWLRANGKTATYTFKPNIKLPPHLEAVMQKYGITSFMASWVNGGQVYGFTDSPLLLFKIPVSDVEKGKEESRKRSFTCANSF